MLRKISDFITDNDEIFMSTFIMFLALFIGLELISCYDKKTSEEIKELSKLDNINIYDKCWKLEGKFYCKENENEKNN